MSDTGAVLCARDVSVTAGTARLVDAVSLSIGAGEVVGLLGANGAGKSTLLKACSGDLRPAGGSVRLHGRDITALSAGELARLRAVVSQSCELSFPFTAREVVLLGATVPGFQQRRADLTAAAATALADVGLQHLSHRLYTRLSGGERQRVQIARALCQIATAPHDARSPPLLLLDEPTASLDLAHQRLILARMRALANAGGAVLTVLHDVNLAAAYCDRLLILQAGRVLAAGRPRDVIVSPILSEAYGCRVDANAVPAPSIPFALPVTHTIEGGLERR
jgi:iron complex transport system ATP-binding protein